MLPIDPYARVLRRHHGAILTPLFVVLAFAAPLRALPETEQATGAAPDAEKPAAAATAPAKPKPLTAVEPLFDLGTLVHGDLAPHTFVLRNNTDRPLTIERLAPDCNCMKLEHDKTVPPGGQGTVRAELDTKTITGAGISSIGVFLEGHEGAAAVLQLKYRVETKLLAHPGYARWIFVQHEREGTLAQTVYANDGAEFKVVSAEPPAPFIKVSFREAKPEERRTGYAGSQWRVEPTLESTAPVGAIKGFITVHTTHPRQKVMRIPVSGFVRPILFVDPERSDFGTLELSSPRHTVYQVRNFATEPIALTGAETDVPGTSARVEPVEAGRRYRVIVVFDPSSMKEGPFAGKLRLKTDSEKVPTVTVDFTGTLVRQEAAEKSG